MKKIASLFLLFALLHTLQAQDVDYAREVMCQLGSPQMYGRSYSHYGDSIAATYLRNEFQRLGVAPLGNNYWQTYTVDAFPMEGECSVTLNGRKLTPYTEFRLLSAKRYASEKVLSQAAWKQQQDGIWFIGKEHLSTFSPLVATGDEPPYCVEILASALPKKVRSLRYYLPKHIIRNYRTHNVCGIVQGEVDSMIVFTAHYDHCGTMGDGVLFPGVHDNASGTAAVLDLARMATQQKPHYTQVFMLFSGEEVGLKGSHYAVEHPLIDLSKVRLLVNIDMFCSGDEGMMVVNANDSLTKPFVDRMEQINNALQSSPNDVTSSPTANKSAQPIAAIKRRNNAANSDHYYFSQHCPAIFIYALGKQYGGYHDPADTCSACGLDYYPTLLQIIASVTQPMLAPQPRP